MKQNIKDFSLEQLTAYIKDKKLPAYYAKQIFGWIYNRGKEDFRLMTDISLTARVQLEEDFYFSRLLQSRSEVSADGTQKFLLGLADGYCIETVFIPEEERATLCLSTQVGCKFRCRFCLSGKDGFKRNLSAAEIVDQYLTAARLAAPRPITNVVFMGIGEPLDNFDNTIAAVKIFSHPLGVRLGKGKVSISTCGLAPQIKKLADLKLGVKLSISLHAADDNLRAGIMPVNKKYPLDELMAAARYFSKQARAPVTFEYVLLPGTNMSRSDAVKLAKLLSRISCKVNLIPYNKSLLDVSSPPRAETDAFTRELKKRRVFYIFRKSRGQDIGAACGQLRYINETNYL